MTDLLDHFLPDAGDEGFTFRIPVHHFGYALVDLAYGFTTESQIAAFFDLTDQDELDQLSVVVGTVANAGGTAAKDRKAREWESVLGITESGAKYQTKAAIKSRMGI